MNTEERLRQICQEVLLAVQVGDAMGMPVEMMTPEEILAATNGEGVWGFIDPVQRRIQGTMELKAGDTTDDWQLTKANAGSLIACRRYDQDDMARRHIEEFRTCTFGWGGTTKKGLQSLIDGRDPFDPPPAGKPGSGCGNGVAMKIAPIALFHAVARGGLFSSLLDEVIHHGRLTHPDPRASVAAYALASAIGHLMRDPVLNGAPEHWLDRIRRFQGWLVEQVLDAEIALNLEHPEEDRVSTRIARALALKDDADALREKVGTGCIAIESVPFSIATFVRHYDNFTKGMLEAVNAGGDTDSSGSMVGALIAANGMGRTWTARSVPMLWREALPDKGEEALRLGDELYHAARNAR